MRRVLTRTEFTRLMSAAAAICVLAGCAQTTVRQTGDGRPMPPAPRAAETVPDGTKATQIALQLAPKPRDTNGNGFPDRIELLAYLFADEPATPFYEDGAFVFELYFGGQADLPGSEPIHTWRIEGAELEETKGGRSIFGPYYTIQLSLLDGENGTDRYPHVAADLTCRFEPADGRPAVVRKEIHRLQIGSAVAGR